MEKSSANIFMKAGKFLVVRLRAKNVFEKEKTEKQWNSFKASVLLNIKAT